MSRVCQITGKKVMVGNNVSHSNKKTKRIFIPNLFTKKFFLAEENRFVLLKVSAAGMRNIDKKGLKTCLEEAIKKGTHLPEQGVPGIILTEKSLPDKNFLSNYTFVGFNLANNSGNLFCSYIYTYQIVIFHLNIYLLIIFNVKPIPESKINIYYPLLI